jgi:hypothetical protein
VQPPPHLLLGCWCCLGGCWLLWLAMCFGAHGDVIVVFGSSCGRGAKVFHKSPNVSPERCGSSCMSLLLERSNS